jgi:hypothetical protein
MEIRTSYHLLQKDKQNYPVTHNPVLMIQYSTFNIFDLQKVHLEFTIVDLVVGKQSNEVFLECHLVSYFKLT